ncbi:GIY-YIG nuclease family protein [Candidatus Nomurabacteria bacterium]|nr:GIY-YIG nuclease family protein [Candidatus Nomurabacteria bacterium]USN94523.1 MAG: GIY-YIG nuclease family protein [Candidatus Nomurabacteria bacterium]
MSYFVYILFSEKDKKLYVGCTSDLEKRLIRHNSGFVESTKNRRPIVLIKKEIFDNKSEAFKRERFLKSLWGAREKSKILKSYIQSNS